MTETLSDIIDEYIEESNSKDERLFLPLEIIDPHHFALVRFLTKLPTIVMVWLARRGL